MESDKYTYKNFGEIFQEIVYDFESKYEPDIWDRGEVRYISIYKTTISSDGQIERKGNRLGTFDPRLFWKVEIMVKLLQDDSTLEVLYGQK